MSKKFYFPAFFLIVLGFFASCTTTTPPSQSFENKVATQVAVVFTATALAEYFAAPTETPAPPSNALSETQPALTATLAVSDPLKGLSQPTFRDDLSNSSIWFKDSTSFSNEFAEFSAQPGTILAVSKRSGGPIWYAYYEKRPQDIYIEARLKANHCVGNDSYGIFLRGKDISEGPHYFFGVKCNGKYEFYTFGVSSDIDYIISAKESSAIHSGSNAVNTLGVWAKDSHIRLYVNGEFLEEFEDNQFLNDGYIGFYIWSVNGAGLSVELDEITYWILD